MSINTDRLGFKDSGNPRQRIVVVDDYADTAALLAETLVLEGFDVRTACDGVSALDVIHAHAPVCVLLDVNMPDMNGLEVARALRERYGPAMVLIAVTGWGERADRIAPHFECFDHYLRKPVDLNTLRRILWHL